MPAIRCWRCLNQVGPEIGTPHHRFKQAGRPRRQTHLPSTTLKNKRPSSSIFFPKRHARLQPEACGFARLCGYGQCPTSRCSRSTPDPVGGCGQVFRQVPPNFPLLADGRPCGAERYGVLCREDNFGQTYGARHERRFVIGKDGKIAHFL